MDIETIDVGWLTKGPLEVKIVKVESPTLIWVHLKNGDRAFRDMMGDLQRRMRQREHYLTYQPDKVSEDDIVAVKEGNRWQRGYVIGVTDQKARIALKDWGRCVWKPFHECHHLQDQFREVEWRAVPIGLAHVGNVKPQKQWPAETKSLTQTLALGKSGWMTIRKSRGLGPGAMVNLVINNSDNGEYDLADMLQQLGHVPCRWRV